MFQTSLLIIIAILLLYVLFFHLIVHHKRYITMERNQQQLQQILSNVPGLIWAADMDGTMLFSEGQDEFLHFADLKQKTGQNIFSIYAYNACLTKGIEQAFAGESVTVTAKHNDRLFHVRICPMYDIDNHQTGILGVSVDATDRVEMIMQLRDSEEKFRTLTEKSRDGIVIAQDEQFTYVNSAFCNMLGYTATELYSMNASDLIVPNERERVMQVYKQHVKDQEINAQYSTTFVHKSGRFVTVEIHSTQIELKDRPAGFISCRDVTESRRIRQELEENEEKYRALVEASQDGICMISKGMFIYVNSMFCRMTGYTPSELYSKASVDLIADEDKKPFLEIRNRRLRGDWSTITAQSTLIHRSGARVAVEMHSTLIIHQNSPVSFFTMHDITARLRAEEEIQQAKAQVEALNRDLEQRILESSNKLVEVNTQLLQLQKEKLLSQFEVLKQQVNPHFLFNSLNVLTSLIKIEPELAEKFTEHLAKVYRYVLENKDNELVNLSTELDFLSAYLFLLDIRFEDKLRVNISISEYLQQLRIIPLALQLLIENAIKHNAMSKKKPLIIDIFVDSQQRLNVINNLQEREAHFASTGVGLQNILNRYQLLNKPSPEIEKTDSQFIVRIPLISGL